MCAPTVVVCFVADSNFEWVLVFLRGILCSRPLQLHRGSSGKAGVLVSWGFMG